MRAQQHGAVVPVLQVDGFVSSTPEQRSVGLRVVNNGVGPAMIRSVTLRRRDQMVGDFSALMAHFPAATDRSWSSVNGRALAPGGEVAPIVFTWPRGSLDQNGLDGLLAEWQDWSVEACYCSVFDRCWTSSSGHTDRNPVRSCPTPESDPFEQIGVAARPEPAP